MEVCHSHNLVVPNDPAAEPRYGIRVTLPPGDPLQNVLGEDWERMHWYDSELERDAAFLSMATRHGYYRDSDTPSQVLEKIVR